MLEHALSLIMNMMRAETPLNFDLKHENFETGVLMLATNETVIVCIYTLKENFFLNVRNGAKRGAL